MQRPRSSNSFSFVSLRKKGKHPSSRIRTSDLRISYLSTLCTLFSSMLNLFTHIDFMCYSPPLYQLSYRRAFIDTVCTNGTFQPKRSSYCFNHCFEFIRLAGTCFYSLCSRLLSIKFSSEHLQTIVTACTHTFIHSFIHSKKKDGSFHSFESDNITRLFV